MVMGLEVAGRSGGAGARRGSGRVTVSTMAWNRRAGWGWHRRAAARGDERIGYG
jgi:hypothetical protein